jgi:[ribosomal protein S5]-alanine N-acetyltransferase
MHVAAELGLRRTAQLVLRRPVAADVEWVAGLHADPRNYTHDPGGAHPPDRARTVAEMTMRNWARDGISYWLVEHAGEPVGMAGITMVALAGRPSWNLYYRFTPAARGHGLGTEAAREALVVAALIDPARPVIVRTRPPNAPARKLAEGIGLQRRADLDAGDGFVVYASENW